MVIQLTLLLAVQRQPLGAVTLTLLTMPSLPWDPIDWLVGEMEKVQAPPACVTVKFCELMTRPPGAPTVGAPSMKILPVRELALVLPATE
jgi:hypothetical protein